MTDTDAPDDPPPRVSAMDWRTAFAEHARCHGLTPTGRCVGLELSHKPGFMDWATGAWSATDLQMARLLGMTDQPVMRQRKALMASGWWFRTAIGRKVGTEDSLPSRYVLAIPKCPVHDVPSLSEVTT